MSLYKAFKELKSLVSSSPDSIDVIDSTFRLHKLTAIILLGCTILISLKQYVGENIHCYHTAHIKDDMFESFCFITSTFSLPVDEERVHMASHPGVYHHMASHPGVYHHMASHPGVYHHMASHPGVYHHMASHPGVYHHMASHPGVYHHMASHPGVYHQGDHRDDSFTTFHNYYQWVAFVLLGQALAFYLPYQLWKVREGGKLKKIIEKMDSDPFVVPEKEKMEVVARYLVDNSGKFNVYAYTLFFCQVLNLLVVGGQLMFIHYFLGGQFLTYGFSVLANASSYLSHMETVFPKVTKCVMETFGVTGKIVKHAGICVLPINVVNEKIYLFLYFWLMALAAWTLLSLLYELVLLAAPSVRKCFLRKRSGSVHRYNVRKVFDRHSTFYGDFIILRKLADNIDKSQFETLVIALGEDMESQQRMGAGEQQVLLNRDHVSKQNQVGKDCVDENVEAKIPKEEQIISME